MGGGHPSSEDGPKLSASMTSSTQGRLTLSSAVGRIALDVLSPELLSRYVSSLGPYGAAPETGFIANDISEFGLGRELEFIKTMLETEKHF